VNFTNFDAEPSMRMAFRNAVFAAMFFFATAFAAEVPTETMPIALAREVANKTIELVESRGLYPRQQAEYDQAKAVLLAAFDGQPAEIARKDLYLRISKLLGTLDTNRHTFLIPAGRKLTVQRKQMAPDDLPPPTFQLLKTDRGTVLRWTPPPIVSGGTGAIAPYLKRFYDEAGAMPDIVQACALVVDLSEQSGGNAWPPFVAMYPLFGDTNKANWVDRDGKRTPFVNRTTLEGMNRNFGDGRANPLSRFGSDPLAVVASKRTASAGEMLLIALLGEARVQTFGNISFGMTTANATYTLADGSTLVLTQSRYALGDGPVYRGGVAPMHQFNSEETVNDGVTMAAKWAAANSSRCSSAARDVITAD
jgi:hypothetical protein